MRSFKELDEILNSEVTDDSWSDDLVLQARTLASDLARSDWDALRNQWRKRPPRWQHRCADVMSRGDPQEVIPILLDMINSSDDELSITAVDSLREVTEPGSLRLTEHIARRLGQLSSKSPLNRLVIEQLGKKIGRKI